jgi:hypothetical protein
MFEHLPGVPASVHNYIPLTIAVGVVVLGRSPDGLVALVTGRRGGQVGALFRPRPSQVRRSISSRVTDGRVLVRSDG